MSSRAAHITDIPSKRMKRLTDWVNLSQFDSL
jgi:hypothetical protein